MANYQTFLDPVFQALADPTRRAVVQRLGNGPATVSDLAAPFDITLPTFLKHISALEAAALITTHKVGRVRSCTLNQDTLMATEKWFGEQRAMWKSRFENLDNLLTLLNGQDDES